MNPTADAQSPEWWVICLCAQWCGVCRDWRKLFEQVAAAHPRLRFAWVDVEDEAQAMGDLDIETFPTMLVASGDSARFFGPIQPSSVQLSRLLASLVNESAADRELADAAMLLGRLKPILLSKS